MKTWIILAGFLCGISLNLIRAEDDQPMCITDENKNAMIYCGGRILEAVNYHHIFNDSKSFVDSPLKNSPQDTLDAFSKKFDNKSPQEIDRDQLKEFVNDYFLHPGHELDECTPVGWTDTPSKLQKIVDPELREWAMQLNKIWKKLCKKMIPDVSTNPDRYSLLPVKHEFIAPGGRFLEPYYWDAYWIVKGLVATEMYEATARMLENYADFVTTYGFIPNGGRVYYLRRSQPPLFIPMVYEFYEATKNASFVETLLETMEAEFKWWDNHKTDVTVNNQKYTLYKYYARSNVPRPESYQQDVDTANKSAFKDKKKLWRDLASAAESGQDFSTRWFADGLNLTTIETTDILPVDLNSYMCWNMAILEYLFDEVKGDQETAKKYREMLVSHRKAVNDVFYNTENNTWFDFNLNTNKHNKNFYASLATPLFTNCYNPLNQAKAEGVYKYFENVGAFTYRSGVPQSIKRDSFQQWDFPNGWGNINHIIIEGFRKSESPAMQDQAFSIAKKWIRGNYRVFNATGHMWEKYDVVGSIPNPGSGGEYDVQDGFGWTNGAILDLLVTYADRITVTDEPKNPSDSSTLPPPPPSQSTGSVSPSSPASVLPTTSEATQSVFSILSIFVITVIVNFFQ